MTPIENEQRLSSVTCIGNLLKIYIIKIIHCHYFVKLLLLRLNIVSFYIEIPLNKFLEYLNDFQP